MIEKVFRYIQKYQMIKEGDTIVAGISGGADSVCLLFVLTEIRKRIPFHLAVVHVNHGIRMEAKEDAEYVRLLCAKQKIPFYLKEADVKVYAKEQGLSEEEAGRIIRYRAFKEVLLKERDNEGGKIAVAHNSNDCAETMLFNLFRGTGLKGLIGIKPVKGNIIRPILCLERKEIEEYLVKNNINRYRLIRNTQNVGTVRHFYNILCEAKGKYIKALGGGDCLYGNDAMNTDERLETIISSMEEDYPIEPSLEEPIDEDEDEDLLR